MKLSEFKKQIREHIVEILSEAEDTATEKASNSAQINAEKAKIKAAQERIANLQKGVNESEGLDEMSRQAGTVSIIDKETAAAVKANFRSKVAGKVIDLLMNYEGNEPLTKKQIAIELGYGANNQPAVNPTINALVTAGVLKIAGSAPSEPVEKAPKVKMVKPKALSIPKDETPEDVKDTYYDVDAEDVGFDEKEPSVKQISKADKEIERLKRDNPFKIYDDEDEDF
jgi:hypothetical protein